MDEKYIVKSLVKAMHVLECFSVQQPELGVSDIAKMLDLQKSTVFNILNTFEACGYIIQDPKSDKYHLGMKVLHLGYIVNHHMGLRDMFLPCLSRIADETGEVSYFGILDNREVLYIEAAYPKNHPQTRNILGERAPLYCTGLGKAMLAFLPEEEQQLVLRGELKKYTQYTLSDPTALQAQLRQIRTQGYAIDDMEHELGIRCVAVPVFGASNAVIAAVSISGPSMRFNHDTLVRDAELIKETLAPLQHCL